MADLERGRALLFALTSVTSVTIMALAACGQGDPAASGSGSGSGASGAGGGAEGGASGAGGGAGGLPYAPLEICINELMPDNEASVADETGAKPDWIELHNPGASDVSLEGWSLTDDAAVPTKSAIPAGLMLPAGGFVVLWADGGAAPGPTHLGFKLAKDGGVIGLFAPDGRGSLVSYGAIEADFSAARVPDCCEGEGCFAFDFRGTPGKSNVPVVLETVTALPAGSVLLYLDSGGAPPAGWAEPAFDDTAWKSGPAPLGYGDPHIATVISYGADPANKPISAYFRARFDVTGKDAIVEASLELLRDDGARVFLNGVEVARSNLPEGDLAPQTPAVVAVGDAEETAYITFGVDPARLVEGSNTLAIEVHQATANSSDLGVDVAISVTRPAP
jgi:hypothetical protein